MHRHGDEDRTAPFVGNGEATSQDEQRRKRREMCVRGREEQCVHRDSEKTAEIALDYPVEEKSKKKFLNHGSDRHCENDNHYSLLDRGRRTEKLDDVLLARTAFEKPLPNGFAHEDQWISKKQEDYSSGQSAKKTDSEKSA